MLCATSIGVEPRAGTVVNGAIVLDDADGLVEGASVTVWVGEPSDPVTVSDAELELIDQGQRAAARGELLDARTFLIELRRRSVQRQFDRMMLGVSPRLSVEEEVAMIVKAVIRTT